TRTTISVAHVADECSARRAQRVANRAPHRGATTPRAPRVAVARVSTERIRDDMQGRTQRRFWFQLVYQSRRLERWEFDARRVYAACMSRYGDRGVGVLAQHRRGLRVRQEAS